MTAKGQSFSLMYQEAAEAPSVVQCQLERNASLVDAIGERLRSLAPRALVTCARGSSDHAATFGRYLIEAQTGVICSSAAPSLSSLYEARSDFRRVVFLAISQSGKSPDLLAATGRARECGAYVIVVCNYVDSPLADLADQVIPLHAGAEKSVAATKSYIASLAAIVQLVACWTQNAKLTQALASLPGNLAQAWQLDWGAAATSLHHSINLYTVGRGFGLGVAEEAALKLKETCSLHAEAFSAAEVRHGPMALVGKGFPVLMFAQHDPSRQGIIQLARDFAERGARVFIGGATVPDTHELPALSAHRAIEPILMIQSFYRMANALAQLRGLDPDAPPHLKKVTETT